jgi:hypothetical protein
MLNKLIAIQQREALTDTGMALRLGLSRSHWNLVKNGHRTLTHEMAVHAVGQWPELTRDLLDMATVRVSASTNSRTEAA